MDLGIRGKNALVCGASKGMGRAIAVALASEGANVYMCAREESTLKEAVDAAKATGGGGKIEHCSCDVSNPESRKKMVERLRSVFGHVDILVHNSGGPKTTQAESTKPEEWQAGFDLLFQSIVHLNLEFVPDMKERKWGRIIAVTSLSVMEPIAGLAVSNGIRSAVTAMLKTLSDELAPFNITVNCVAPGSIGTGRIEELVATRAQTSGKSKEEYMQEYVKAIPAGRMGTPEEFAAVVAFLVSMQASYVTGSTICVDGGRRRSTY
jgi:3-oxoacyl-[acyl-carrier protein] reductase